MKPIKPENIESASRHVADPEYPPGTLEPDLLADLRRGELGYIIRACGISGKLQRCIIEGPEENQGDWDHMRTDRGLLDRTAIDFEVVAALLVRDVSPDDIGGIYEHFAIGRPLQLLDPATREAYLSTIIEAVRRRADQTDGASDPDTVLVRAVTALVAQARGTWQGTPTGLLEALTSSLGEPPLGWPDKPGVLSKALKRVARRLEKAGIEIHSDKEPGGSRRRQVTLRRKVT